ncbi:hypothetical protein HZI73_24855 [Vallitalea pronyensis]|uniref:Uncharacterized protein n=1 Tax=Vallitalea pronyensis TaxID=1348613 RepID=A0A8J8SJ62_9FIRM|nr:hypothetical protein [Vallitalea pronyensis]QUI25331.1 hypothetical protein HZI73_24855 [Vallitalea pronyensis]
MKVNIMLKSSNKTRGIQPVPYTINNKINILQDLIHNLVDIEIDKYEHKELQVLSQEDIDRMLINGKVSFGFQYRANNKIDRKHAKKVASLAFQDGLYAVFIGNQEIVDLSSAIHLKENDSITFIRFTMLAGRYF